MCDRCPSGKMAEVARKMLDSGDFKWAHDFLTSMANRIAQEGHVTESQMATLKLIASRGPKNVPKGAVGNDRKRSGLFS